MNESEHTPGPWIVHRGGGHARPNIQGAEVRHTNGRLANEQGISSASFSDEVCQFFADLDLPTPQANARLIVAAPDLLAACRVCVSTITQVVESEAPTSTDWVNIRAARHLALAAIDKAGEKL
jgi:hypothetical protein